MSLAGELDLGAVDLRLREPAVEPTGALILSHGRGADEHDLHPLLDELDPERQLLGVTTGAPIRGVPPGGRHWYVVEQVGYPHAETFHHSYPLLADRLDALLADRGLDWSRTILGGFSQGAVMAYALALGAGRPTPAGVLAFSGFIPEVDGWEPAPEGREGLGVLIHHGSRDPMIDVGFARAARDRLRAAGLEPRYLESDAGHWLPPDTLPAARELIGAALAPLGGGRQ